MGSNFNIWYLMIPVFAVVTFLFGTTKYRVNQRWKIVSTSKGDTLLSVIAAVFSVSIQVMVIAESLLGLIQLISDITPERDMGWLPILMTGALMASFAVFDVLFYYSGKLGERAMYALIRFLLRRRAKQMRKIEKELQAPEVVHL